MSKPLLDHLEDIAAVELSISTLKRQNRDRLDFHEIAVWQIRKALEEAYKLGKKHGMTETCRMF